MPAVYRYITCWTVVTRPDYVLLYKGTVSAEQLLHDPTSARLYTDTFSAEQLHDPTSARLYTDTFSAEQLHDPTTYPWVQTHYQQRNRFMVLHPLCNTCQINVWTYVPSCFTCIPRCKCSGQVYNSRHLPRRDVNMHGPWRSVHLTGKGPGELLVKCTVLPTCTSCLQGSWWSVQYCPRVHPTYEALGKVDNLYLPDSRLRALDYRLQTTGPRLQAPEYILQTTGSRLRALDYRLQTPDYRLQTTGSRLQAPGYRLQTTSPRLSAWPTTHPPPTPHNTRIPTTLCQNGQP